MIQELLHSTKVSAIMVSPVVTIRKSDDLHIVLDKFVTHDIRHLPVINEPGNVVGLISQRHLYKIHSPRRLEDGSWYYDKDMLDTFILKNVMVPDPFLLQAENTLHEAMSAMAQSRFGCIPIVDRYRSPVGIITRSDILRFFLTHA